MKKYLFAGLCSVSLAAVSCSNAKTAVANAQAAQTQHAEVLKMKGDWQITSVNYDKGYIIKPFDENADAKCWVGSTWHLVPNNFRGEYDLNGGGSCPTVKQPISFEITTANEFRFKKLIAGSKAKAVTSGYSLQMTNQSQSNFSLVQTVPFNGTNVQVVYNFQKISK